MHIYGMYITYYYTRYVYIDHVYQMNCSSSIDLEMCIISEKNKSCLCHLVILKKYSKPERRLLQRHLLY